MTWQHISEPLSSILEQLIEQRRAADVAPQELSNIEILENVNG